MAHHMVASGIGRRVGLASGWHPSRTVERAVFAKGTTVRRTRYRRETVNRGNGTPIAGG